MKKKNEASIKHLIDKMNKDKAERQRNCDHSFNDRNYCEYCHISLETFEQTGYGIYQ